MKNIDSLSDDMLEKELIEEISGFGSRQ